MRRTSPFLAALALGSTVGLARCKPAADLRAPPAASPGAAAPEGSRTSGVALVLSDLHFDPFADAAVAADLRHAPAREWGAVFRRSLTHSLGTYGEDSTFALLESALDAARATVPAPDFVVVTGDLLRHNFDAAAGGPPSEIEALALDTLTFVTGELASRFPDAPIFPVLGNNDTPGHDYDIRPRSPFLRAVGELWAPLANRRGGAPDFAASFQEGGYYTARLPTLPHARIVGLDSVLWSSHYGGGCSAPPAGNPGAKEIVWLDGALRDAENGGDVAWLASHIPPGVDVFSAVRSGDVCAPGASPPRTMYCDGYARDFLDVVGKHPSVVGVAFGGHTHMADYRLYRLGGRPAVAHVLAPAVSPKFGNNPGFFSIRFDRASGALLDVVPHVLDLAAATAKGGAPSWSTGAGWDARFHRTDVLPASLAAVRDAIATDAAAREAYVDEYNGGSSKAGIATPWRAYACGIDRIAASDFMQCACRGGAP